MALPITQQTDYITGKYTLAFDKLNLKDFNAYRDDTEQSKLDNLLGCDLAELFINDLDNSGVPQDPRFTVIFNKLCVEYCGKQYISQGIKKMLQGFVWHEVSRYKEAASQQVGTKILISENAENAGFLSSRGLHLYNLSINDYLTIQYYICQNIETYPEYNGVFKNYKGITD